jgi:hypothetical protein
MTGRGLEDLLAVQPQRERDKEGAGHGRHGASSGRPEKQRDREPRRRTGEPDEGLKAEVLLGEGKAQHRAEVVQDERAIHAGGRERIDIEQRAGLEHGPAMGDVEEAVAVDVAAAHAGGDQHDGGGAPPRKPGGRRTRRRRHRCGSDASVARREAASDHSIRCCGWASMAARASSASAARPSEAAMRATASRP